MSETESESAALSRVIRDGAPAPGYVFSWLEKFLMRLLPSRVIPDSCGRPYLARYFLWPFWKTCEEASKHPRAIMLHHILKSDEDCDLHDHPWNFTSVILWGSYEEVLPLVGSTDGTQEVVHHHWLSVIRHAAADSHRLILERPAWTLVLRGEKKRRWGFHTKDGWVHWQKYCAEKPPC